MAKELASLAVTREEQGGKLKIRQREQLRRALATAAEPLGWAAIAASEADPVRTATKDVAKLTKTGTTVIAAELADELAEKKTEMSKLAKAAKTIRKLAEKDDGAYPAEITYSHTARDASVGLVTKTEELTLNDSSEAEDAASTIEKRMESWGKLREQMVQELKQKRKQMEEMTQNSGTFVESTQGLVRDVLATLH